MVRVALTIALLLAPGCAGTRALVRDLSNEHHVGREAPPVEGGTWVGEAVTLDDQWTLIAFLKPG